MKCPKCRRVQYYVCGNEECVCAKRVPKGKMPQISDGNDGISCPYCGFITHIDYWEERSMQDAYKKDIANAQP